MPLDPSQVQWDAIDPGQVKWDAPPEDLKAKLAKETSGLDAFTVAAGKTGDRLLEGLKQSGMGIGAIFSEMLPERLKRAAQEEITKKLLVQEKLQKQKEVDDKTEYAALEKEKSFTTLAGEIAPALAAPMLRAVSGGAGATAINASLSAALPAGLEYGTAEERAKRAGIAGVGGVVGSGITQLASKAFSGVANVLTPEARRIAALAEEKFNIPLDAAQKTGNKALQTVDAAFEHMPVTSGAEAAKKGVQRDAFTREVMKTMGEAADEATGATWSAGKKRISGDFERIFSKVHVNLDDTGVQANLSKVIQESVDTLPQETATVVVKRASQLLDKIDDNGAVAGKAYQAWRSQVQKQAEKTSDPWLASQLQNLYRAVDDQAYKAAAEAGEEAALKTARGQWKNMRTIEPLVAKSEDGRISPKLLRGEVMRHNPDFAAGGGGDLGELAHIGRSFISDQVPNSGTAQRAMAQSLLTGGAMGGVGWAASGDPMTGAKFAAGGLALPKAAQMALNSKAGQGFMMGEKALTPLQQALMDRAARVAALGYAQQGVE